ncbi:hypothetical protein FHX42_001135 [Saccharopolyspora lacisalsi]|uniref:Uncharacterized protein n=1 Tax=Halosaccharopolyspora lacisalsi TaxID=1000566 RepID=A0A839DU54_9PSEU|nr:hypothetical protein [Halosaccharopolyspora lacisalsi]MBA8823806.1 hypothetical protein [Halosaccharopolyspora lacisalsi]
MLAYLALVTTTIRARIERIRADERGYSTETVLVTALLVAGAIVVLGIIVAAVTNKANEISNKL